MESQRETDFERFIRQLHGRHDQDGTVLKEVAVEAGHIYVNEQPGDEHYWSLELAAELSDRLVRVGIRVVQILFVDDYNPEQTTMCRRKYLANARALGFNPVEIIMESDLITDAEQVIATLAEAKLITHHEDGAIRTTSPKINLKKPDGKLSCAALDAAFYCYRFQKWPFSITILPGDSPRRYQDQQRHTRRLLRLLGHQKLPLANIWFRKSGELAFSVAS